VYLRSYDIQSRVEGMGDFQSQEMNARPLDFGFRKRLLDANSNKNSLTVSNENKEQIILVSHSNDEFYPLENIGSFEPPQ
jgi:hypothetical protein